MKSIRNVFILSLSLLIGPLAWGQANLSFSFANPQIVNGGTHFQFDIHMAASFAGTYHSQGLVYFDYNVDAFGGAIVGAGNISVQPLGLLNEEFSPGTNKYDFPGGSSVLTLKDNSDSRVSIPWKSNFQSLPPGSTFHTEVPTTLTPLFRVTIEILDNSKQAGISFNNLMDGETYFQIQPNPMPYGTPYNYVNNLLANSLPVEWLDFRADPLNRQKVLVAWTTASELNNDYFEIEKKGEKEGFQKIGQVPGQGNSQDIQSYSFIDQSPMSPTVYYRLRQVDIDGRSSLSDVVQVNFDVVSGGGFVLYPSPAKSEVQLKALDFLKIDHGYVMSDLAGHTLMKGLITPQDEFVKIDLSNYAEGVYQIRIIRPNGEPVVLRFIKE